jgi:AraC-like DNA-binding protein
LRQTPYYPSASRTGTIQAAALSPGPCSRRLGFVEDVCSFIRDDPTSRITLAHLGKRFGVSPYHLQKTFVEVMGISPRRYTEECRVAVLKLRLAKGEPVVGALRGAGYSSHSWLYRDSRAKLGMTPANYKAGGAGRLVMYAIGTSRLGRLLVATTSRGICSVKVGEDDRELVGALRREYPRARIVRSRRVASLVSGQRPPAGAGGEASPGRPWDRLPAKGVEGPHLDTPRLDALFSARSPR